jgi:SAM-dependent methyltransferase
MAFGDEWTSAHAGRMTELFDGLAAEWADRVDDTKLAPIEDALDRGGVPAVAWGLEIGTGTGVGASARRRRGATVVATDISPEMLRQNGALDVPKMRVDSSALPVRARSVDAVLLVNMLLFPGEIDRVIRPTGSLVWVNTRGDQTPIHLPAADVLEALPGVWQGVSARAGTGFWLVARRVVDGDHDS